MEKSSRRTIILIVVMGVLIICAGISVGAYFVFNQILEIAQADNTPFIIQSPVPRSTSSATKIPANTPGPGTVVPTLAQGILEQMLLIQEQVIEFRGLDPNAEITRLFYTPEELREIVTTDFFSDYSAEDASIDVTILSLFGLLEPDADILNIYIELYSGSIAGFYDPETKEMVIVKGAFFGGAEHLTYAHEYTHALQDQTYDLNGELGYNEEECEQDSEGCAALQALIEGDATFSELFWYYEYATQQQRAEIEAFYENYDFSANDIAPPFLLEDFGFPYTKGQDFVMFLYESGGWLAVDNAYATPPASTEQIIHPERYPNDIPIIVNLPDLTEVLGSEWEILDEDVLGEWYTTLMLAYGIDETYQLPLQQAQNAAEGWGGDAYAIYQDTQTGQTALALQHEWDTALDATEYVDAFTDYATRRFGIPTSNSIGQTVWVTTDGYHIFNFQGNHTTWIFAPDKATAEAMLQSIQTQ